MGKIIKWLEAQGIEFQYSEKRRSKCVVILLEKDCIWVNGFNQPMRYDRNITIYYNTYKTYTVTEVTGYSRHATLAISTRAEDIIEVLAERFAA